MVILEQSWMGKRRPSLDLVFSISRVSSSSLTQVLECSFLVVSRKAGHMLSASFEEANRRFRNNLRFSAK